jgi:hypothetical protein
VKRGDACPCDALELVHYGIRIEVLVLDGHGRRSQFGWGGSSGRIVMSAQDLCRQSWCVGHTGKRRFVDAPHQGEDQGRVEDR